MRDSHHRKSEWEQRYRAGRTGWDRGDASPALEHWLSAGLIPQGRVLVPGCGHGHEVAELIRYGCDVTAVDIASQPVERLRGQLEKLGLQARLVQADLLNWQPQQHFEAVYEQTCICALDPTHWAEYEQRLYDWLVPGGRLLALFMQTGRAGGPPFDCPVPDMRMLFAGPRWRWPEGPPLEVPHPNGLVEHGFLITRC